MKQKQIIERLEKILDEFNNSDDQIYGLNFNLVHLIMQLKNIDVQSADQVQNEMKKRKLTN